MSELLQLAAKTLTQVRVWIPANIEVNQGPPFVFNLLDWLRCGNSNTRQVGLNKNCRRTCNSSSAVCCLRSPFLRVSCNEPVQTNFDLELPPKRPQQAVSTCRQADENWLIESGSVTILCLWMSIYAGNHYICLPAPVACHSSIHSPNSCRSAQEKRLQDGRKNERLSKIEMCSSVWIISEGKH